MNRLSFPTTLTIVAMFECLLIVAANPVNAQPSDSPNAGVKKQPAPAADDSTSGQRNDDGVLPWNQTVTEKPILPGRRRSSAREMLELFNIDASQLEQLSNGQPFHEDDNETLWKILYRMPQFGQDKIESWRLPEVDWEGVRREPAKFRTEVFQISGRAKRLQTMQLPELSADRFEYSTYYRVEMEAESPANPVVVFCRTVPQAWIKKETLDQPASFFGLFLKSGDSTSDDPELYFAADRVAWRPEQANTEDGVTPDMVMLSELGVDIGLFDDIRETNKKAIVGADRECFYQMLAATESTDIDRLAQHAIKGIDWDPVLNDPQSQQGNIFQLDGTARRVTRIEVGDADIQERFGIDHYYQIDVFVPLGDQEVRIGKNTKDKDAPVFRNSYPVTCCALELPPGLKAEADISQRILVVGFYFKLWAYKTDYMSAHDSRQRQVGPMFIIATPKLLPPAKGPFGKQFGVIVGAAVAAAFVGLLIGAWLFRRSDRKFDRQVFRHQYEVDEGKSLNDIGIQASDGPDFSGLDHTSDR